MKIIVMSNVNLNSPSIRYRLKYPFDLIKKNREFNFEYFYFFSQETEKILNSKNQILKIIYSIKDFFRFIYTIKKIKYCDFLIVKNYIFPFGDRLIEKILLKHLKAKEIFYDIDDAIYLNSTREQNKMLSRFRNASDKVNFWTNKANKIFVSNDIIINDLINKFEIPNEKFVQFLTCPYEKQYFNNSSEIVIAKAANKEVNFIWLGSPHTQDNLRRFSKLIEELPNFIHNVRIVIMGASQEFELFRNLKHVTFIAWSPENEKIYMQKAHFGLNPLVDHMFENRKSAFKVIQYYRAGIIPIVSDVGINESLVRQYGGFCISSTVEDTQIYDFVRRSLQNHVSISKEIYEKTKHLSIEHNTMIIDNNLFG